MSYFPKGHHDTPDEVDDFDEYDPTPYGGGYNIELTYGRPLDASEEICYPNASSASDDFDYDRLHYTSSAEPSAYGDDALDNEYKSYARPKPRPGRPNRPAGGYGGESEYGSGGGRTEYGEQGSGRYGRRPEYGDQGSEYGSGGYGRRPEYGDQGSEYGSGGGGYGRRDEEESGGGYGRRPERSEYQSEGYERPNYGRSEEEDYRKPRRDDDDDEGYGRRKYVSIFKFLATLKLLLIPLMLDLLVALFVVFAN